MKLDRNVNPNGRGRYALIHLRRCIPQVGDVVIVPTEAVSFGNPTGETPGEQFFVLKYKDKFTAAALRAYARAVEEEANSLEFNSEHPVSEKTIDEFREFAAEIYAEAEKAKDIGYKTPTPLRPSDQ